LDPNNVIDGLENLWRDGETLLRETITNALALLAAGEDLTPALRLLIQSYFITLSLNTFE